MATKKGYLFGYYKNEAEFFFKSIRRLHENFDADDLHRLRVSIKRIRTIYRLLEEFSDGRFDGQKHYSFFRKIFNQAGKVRELQVNRLLILENGNSSGKLKFYLHALDKKKEKYSSSFIRNLKQINTPELKRDVKKIKKRCKKIGNDYFLSKALELINSEIKTIKQLQDISTQNANIHKIRKHLKILYSLVKLSHSIKPIPELKKLKLTVKETEESLGLWHDRIILLSSLKKFKQDNRRQALHIKKLIVSVEKQNEVLLSVSLSKMGSIFKSLPKQLC
jgi:CHAD domain-containing protein